MTLRHGAIIDLYRWLAVRSDEFGPDQKDFRFDPYTGECLSPSGGKCFCRLKAELPDSNCWVQLTVKGASRDTLNDTWSAKIFLYDPSVAKKVHQDAPGEIFGVIYADKARDNTTRARVIMCPSRLELLRKVTDMITGLRTSP